MIGGRERGVEAMEGLLVVVLVLVPVSPPACLLGAGLWWWLRRHWSCGAFVGLGTSAVIGAALLVLLRFAWLPLLSQLLSALFVAHSASGALRALVGVWLWGAWLSPTVAMLLTALPLPPSAQFQGQQQAAVVTRQRAERHAHRRLQGERLPQVPNAFRWLLRPLSRAGFLHPKRWPTFPAALLLGTSAGGDLPWVQKGWLALPADKMGHVVIIGETGSGKTETILRLAVEARKLGWQVLYLDGKGNEGLAIRFLAAMQEAGGGRVAYFPIQSYDGWRGSESALYNRLLAIQPFSQEYYQRVAHLVLGWAVNASKPVAWSSQELLSRLDQHALLGLYRGQPQARRIKATPEEALQGVSMRYEAFFTTVGGQLDGSWAFEDVEAAYLQLGGLALKTEANSLGRFFLEEVAQYVVQRKSAGQPVLLIVDELSALAEGVSSAVDLFERSRFYGVQVVVSSQSDAALGAEAERLLKAGNTLIVHRYGYPAPLLARAGKEFVLEQSWGADAWGQASGRDVLRQREVLRVAPERVQQLETGTAVVVAGGRAGVVCVAPVVVSAATRQRTHALVWGSPPGQGSPPPPQPKATRPLTPPGNPPGGNLPVQPPSQLPGTSP